MKRILESFPASGQRRILSFAAGVLVFLALTLVAGCGTTMRFGRMPDVSRLARLTPKSSTKADVLQALGSPKGGGRSQFPVEQRPRELWFYYHEEATLKEAHRIFLFVFFDEGRYDGYLWFSSLPQIQPIAK